MCGRTCPHYILSCHGLRTLCCEIWTVAAWPVEVRQRLHAQEPTRCGRSSQPSCLTHVGVRFPPDPLHGRQLQAPSAHCAFDPPQWPACATTGHECIVALVVLIVLQNCPRRRDSAQMRPALAQLRPALSDLRHVFAALGRFWPTFGKDRPTLTYLFQVLVDLGRVSPSFGKFDQHWPILGPVLADLDQHFAAFDQPWSSLATCCSTSFKIGHHVAHSWPILVDLCHISDNIGTYRQHMAQFGQVSSNIGSWGPFSATFCRGGARRDRQGSSRERVASNLFATFLVSLFSPRGDLQSVMEYLDALDA